MRKVILVYARAEDSNLILIGTIPSRITRINALRLLARIKEFWLDKEQRSSRKKLFVSAERAVPFP